MTIPASAVAELLTLTVTVGIRSVRVTATGEVDACTAPQLATATDEVLATVPVANSAAGPVQLTVDLHAVTFLDSSGVHALARAYRRATAAGVRFAVGASRPAVLRPLQVSGLWPLIAAADSPTVNAASAGNAA